MQDQITKQEADKLANKPGKVRGEVFNTRGKYILQKKGREGLEKVKKEAEKLDHPIPLDTANPLAWYPVGLTGLTFILVRQVFDWGNEDLIDMGYTAPVRSFIVRLLIKYFVSFERVLRESPKYWRKHYNVGRLEAYELDMKKKYFILRIYNFKIHPDFCIFYLGYFKRMAEFGGQENISVKETKCMFRGDPYHEFLVSWE